MRYLLISFLSLFLSACGSSSSDVSSNPLAGTWLSNCYELTDENGLFIAYKINNLVIAGGEYTSNTSDFTDVNCTNPAGGAGTQNSTYTLGGQVTASDGVQAQCITLISEYLFYGQPVTITYEAIFRITGVELNFGGFVSGQTPSLDYSVTYIKQ